MGPCVRHCSGGCSQLHSDGEKILIFLTNNLQLGRCANSAALRTAFNGVTIPELWSNSDRVSWKREQVDDDNRMQVDSLTNGKNQKRTHTNNACNRSNTDINTCRNCGRTGNKGQHNKKRQTRACKWTWWKRISLPKLPQPCRNLHRNRARSELSRAIQKLNRKDGS